MGDAVWPERSEFIGAAVEDIDFQPPNAAGFALGIPLCQTASLPHGFVSRGTCCPVVLRILEIQFFM